MLPSDAREIDAPNIFVRAMLHGLMPGEMRCCIAIQATFIRVQSRLLSDVVGHDLMHGRLVSHRAGERANVPAALDKRHDRPLVFRATRAARIVGTALALR